MPKRILVDWNLIDNGSSELAFELIKDMEKLLEKLKRLVNVRYCGRLHRESEGKRE